MTVCAVVLLHNAIVAIADGRLTFQEQRGLDTADKLVEVQPAYKIPIIQMQHFSHFTEYKAPGWFVAYAGSYTLCDEVLNDFRRRISDQYLSRDYDREGAPYITSNFEKTGHYDDSYNFSSQEIPKFHHAIVVEEFKNSFRLKADEWLGNGRNLESEFLLFGRTDRELRDAETPSYVAFRITANRDQMGRARVLSETAHTLEPLVIGDPEAVAAIVTDKALREEIASSLPDLDSVDERDRWLVLADASHTDGVSGRFVQIIKDLEIVSVGGHIKIATGRQGSEIKLAALP